MVGWRKKFDRRMVRIDLIHRCYETVVVVSEADGRCYERGAQLGLDLDE